MDTFEQKFLKETKHLDPESIEYRLKKAQYEALKHTAEKEAIFRGKATKRIVELIQPFKHIQISTVRNLDANHLIRIGVALDLLKEELEKAGISSKPNSDVIKRNSF